jgi:hypothetical protein
LVAGVATFQLSTLPVGTETLTATYQGNSSFAGSTSNTLTITVAVQPAAPDFTLATNQTALSVQGGQNAVATLTIAPLNGFSQPVALQCSGLPVGASCTFGSPVVQANGAETVTVTISTATLAALEQRLADTTTICIMFPFMGLLSTKRRKALRNTTRIVSIAFILALSVGALTGCGATTQSGSNSGGTTTNPTNPADPTPQTSTITITAKTQSGTLITHTTQIALTVN